MTTPPDEVKFMELDSCSCQRKMVEKTITFDELRGLWELIRELVELVASHDSLIAELRRENEALRNLTNNLQPGPISEAMAGTRYTREAELIAERDALREKLAEAERDAARYRWLRSKGGFKHVDPQGMPGISVRWEFSVDDCNDVCYADIRLDAVIDAQLEKP